MKIEKKYIISKIFEQTFDQLLLSDKIWLSLDLLSILSAIEVRKKKDIEDILFLIYKNLESFSKKISIMLIPSFTFDFPKTKIFNKQETNPQIGAFPNFLFKKNYFKRTLHPFYSFYVFGNESESFLEKTNKLFHSVGDNSIFEFILKSKFQLLSIGHHYASALSTAHHTEYLLDIKYRNLVNFEGKLIDNNLKITKTGKYNFFVRKTAICDFSGITKKAVKDFENEKISSNTLITIFENKLSSFSLNLFDHHNFIINNHNTNNLLIDYLHNSNRKKDTIMTNNESLKYYKRLIN